LPSEPANFLPPIQRENPYLQSLKSEASVIPTGGRPTIMPLDPIPRSTPPAIVAPPVPAAPPTKIPDFAKPGSDDKYFKQLKRF